MDMLSNGSVWMERCSVLTGTVTLYTGPGSGAILPGALCAPGVGCTHELLGKARTVLYCNLWPERVAGLTGLRTSDRLTPETLAQLICHPVGGLKAVPASARVVPLLNKVESRERQAVARLTGRLLLRNDRVDRVVLGALGTTEPLAEVQSRVTAVVLAAGESRRMGRIAPV